MIRNTTGRGRVKEWKTVAAGFNEKELAEVCSKLIANTTLHDNAFFALVENMGIAGAKRDSEKCPKCEGPAHPWSNTKICEACVLKCARRSDEHMAAMREARRIKNKAKPKKASTPMIKPAAKPSAIDYWLMCQGWCAEWLASIKPNDQASQ